MVRKISGKQPSGEAHHLKLNYTEVTELSDITNTMGQTSANDSVYCSSNIYTSKFQAFRSQAETQQLEFESHNCETYNFPFSADELYDAIAKSHDTAVGPDDIYYQMLKRLPSDAQQTVNCS